MNATHFLRPVARMGLPMLATLVAACGGGGGNGGGGGGTLTAPTGLSYGTPRATYLVGVEIPTNVASFAGQATSFSVVPPLPAGLQIDTLTGDLIGTPTAVAPRGLHTVTISNSGGSTSFDVELAVEKPARFLLTASAVDSTLSSYRLDARTGGLLPHSFAAAGNDQTGPETISVHPNGRFAYVPNAVTDNVSVYAVDTTTGFLEAGTPVPVGSGPHRMVLRPDGAFAFVLSEGASEVLVFEIDGATGALAQRFPSMPTRPGPLSVAIDPTGRYLLVGNGGTPRSLQLFETDPVSGALSGPLATVGLNGGLPSSIGFDPSGQFAFATLENYDALVSLSIDAQAGTLSLIAPSGTGDQPGALAVHPLGELTYVTNRATGSISSFRVDPQTGTLSPLETVAAGTTPSNAVLDPTGSFLYVLDRGGREVLVFHVEGETGILTETGRVRARQMPVALALVPGDGPVRALSTHAYVTNGDSDDVSTYRIDAATGAFSEVGLAALSGDRPSDIALDPLRRFAWVADQGDDTLRTYAIDQVTGALYENAPALALALGAEPAALVVDPSGRFLFAALRGLGTVGAFRISSTDGSLLQTATLALPGTLTELRDLAIDPTGQFLFAAAEGDGGPGTGGVALWSVDATNGVPAQLVPPTLGPRASRLAVHPTARQLYVLERELDALSVFSIASSNGALTPVASAALAGSAPSAVVVESTGQAAYVILAELAGLGSVSRHPLDSSSGALDVAASTVLAGSAPVDAALAASGRFLCVLGQGSNSIAIYRRDSATGELSPPVSAMTGLAPTAIALSTAWQ